MVRIAVIGAGASGITAVKTCLEYGYDVRCYEKTADMGGLWRYKAQECDGEASVMKSTIINTSKEMCAFSDHPPPPEFANYMHNRQMLKYFRDYAEKHGVLERIEYRTSVELVKRAADYADTGRWMVTVKNLETGRTSTELFDGVLLCSGHHVEPYEPDFPGLRDTFKGRVLHSHSYKNDRGFEDQNVLVVGIGNSGADVTVELSRSAKQVYLVTRRGSWIWNRVFDNGLPMDMFLNSHYYDYLIKVCPRLVQAMTERKLLKKCDLETYGLMPAHHLFQQHPTMSDELPNRILSGAVVVKPNIERFVGPRSVRFEDGTVVDDIDAVALCTGYKFGFPYLEPGLIDVINNHVELYKYMYVPNLARPETLAVIGLVQPIGAIFPCSEMQSRVFCEYVQRGATPSRRLPTVDQMRSDIEEKAQQMREIYVTSNRHTIQVAYVPYMNELATMIDAKPLSPLAYLLKGDPKLAWHLATGPCMAYEYRLRGRHAWPGAREAILGAWDRVTQATRTRKAPAHICGNGRTHGFNCLIHEYKTMIVGVVGVLILMMVIGLIFL